jgi:hypothetical protein
MSNGTVLAMQLGYGRLYSTVSNVAMALPAVSGVSAAAGSSRGKCACSPIQWMVRLSGCAYHPTPIKHTKHHNIPTPTH